MRKKSVFRKVLVPLALVIGAMAIGAPGASALVEHPYAGDLLQPGETRNPGEGAILTNITGNIAGYSGAGTVSVCQRTFDFSANVWREGCGNNAVGSATNLMPYFGHSLWPMVYNNSPFAHSINGWYYTS